MFDVCGENERSIGKKLFKKPDSLIEVQSKRSIRSLGLLFRDWS